LSYAAVSSPTWAALSDVPAVIGFVYAQHGHELMR